MEQVKHRLVAGVGAGAVGADVAGVVLEAEMVREVPLVEGAGAEDLLPVFLVEDREECCKLGRKVAALKELIARVEIELLAIELVLGVVAAAAVWLVLVQSSVPANEKVLKVVEDMVVQLYERP